MKEYSFVSQTTSIYKPVYRATAYQEVKTELVVPDSQPDVLRFLQTDGCAYLHSKDSSAGTVTIGGTAELTVSYLPDGTTGVRKLEAVVPFSGEMRDEAITRESQIQAKVFLTGLETKMINPRKLLLRLTVGMSVCCWEPWDVIIPQEPEGETTELELLRETVLCSLPMEVAEKTFMLSEEFTVPALREEGAELISSVGEILSCNETKAGDQLLIKGETELELLFRTAEGKLDKTIFRMPFSQIMSFEEMAESDRYDVSACLTGAYLTPDSTEPGKLEWELHAVLQCTRYCETELSYYADGFCQTGVFMPQKTTWNLPGYSGCERVEGCWRGTVKTPSQAVNVISVSVLFGAASLRKEESDRYLSSTGEVTVVYEGEDGRILSSRQRIEVGVPCMFPDSEQLQIELKRCGECRGAVADGGVEVQLPYAFSVCRYGAFCLTAIEGASMEEETVTGKRRPSVVMKRFRAGESLWSYAKAYHSSVSLIRTANGLGDDGRPASGTLLIIPTKRV